MSSAVRQVATVVSGRGMIRVAQLVSFVILARVLTPAEFGWYGIVTTGLILAGVVGNLGFRQSLAYQVGQKSITDGEANSTALALWPVLSLLSGLVLIAVYADGMPTSSYVETSVLLLTGVAAIMLITLLQGTFLGRGEIAYFTLSESLPRILLLPLIAGLAWVGAASLSGALWVHVGSFALITPIVLWLAVRGAGFGRVRLDQLGPMLRYGLIFAFNLFLITLGGRLALFVIEHHYSTVQSGQFFAAVRVNEIILEVAAAVGMVLFSETARQDSTSALVRKNARVACWMFWSFAGLAGLVVLAAPFLITAALGSGYEEASPVLQILAIGLAPAAANKVIYPSFAGMGYPFFGTPVIVTGLTVNAILALTLIPPMGAEGGAIAVVAGQYVIFCGYVLSCRLRFSVPFRVSLVPTLSGLHWDRLGPRLRRVTSRLRRVRGRAAD